MNQILCIFREYKMEILSILIAFGKRVHKAKQKS